MSGKEIKKTGQKITDVTKPKKADVAQPLVQSRPMMARSIAVSTPVAEDPQMEPATTAPVLPAARRTVIQPLNNQVAEEGDTGAPTQKPDEASEPVAPAPQAAPSRQSDPAEDTTPDTQSPDQSANKPTAETKKAIEEAAKAAKREQELEALIDSKQFNVPINAVARKKSIKISAWLTLLLFLLGVVLIDLMLDSGAIWLVQKIPHTNFFQTLINL